MNNSDILSCPRCGSKQLVSSFASRKVFINHDGERIPLLTVNYSLEHPVIEETLNTLSCSCSWSGNARELQ